MLGQPWPQHLNCGETSPWGIERSISICSLAFGPGHPTVLLVPAQEPSADVDCLLAFQGGCTGGSGFPCRNLSKISAVAGWFNMLGGDMGSGTPAVLSWNNPSCICLAVWQPVLPTLHLSKGAVPAGAGGCSRRRGELSLCYGFSCLCSSQISAPHKTRLDLALTNVSVPSRDCKVGISVMDLQVHVWVWQMITG